MKSHFDVIIVGAGAAGLMCAREAGRAGNKIRISGGGKSNFTNLDTSPANYLPQNPHFCKSALARYTQWDFMALMSEHGLTWEEREHCQLFDDGPLQQFQQKRLQETGATLNAWRLVPGGTEGMRTAEVATGGVDTNELSSRTLASRKVPGLYFIGETVDVTGHLGGYNFQWVWASGWCAGQFV